MKIAFITTQINIKTGGGSNLSPHLKASSMRQLGHQVAMITLFPEKNSFLEKPPYDLIESPTRFKNWFLLQIKIFFILKKHENDYDAFAFEGEHFIWGAGLYRMLGGKKPVMMHFNGPIFSIYEHGSLFNAVSIPKRSFKTRVSVWLRKKFEKIIGVRLANHIDLIDADSPVMKQWHEEFGIHRNKIVVMQDFVDLEPYFKKSANKITDKADRINLIYVGRLVPEKGVDTLLMAIKEMKDRHKIFARIIGGGRQTQELMRLANEYGLENNVTFYPWADKETLSDLYHQSDIFVHPARWAEPFGVTVPEAMASGLPVIVPEISGSAWSAGDGGLTFKNGDYRDLKEKIETLVRDPGLRKKLAEKAKNRAREFDYRGSIKILEDLLSGIINKNTYGKSA